MNGYPIAWCWTCRTQQFNWQPRAKPLYDENEIEAHKLVGHQIDRPIGLVEWQAKQLPQE